MHWPRDWQEEERLIKKKKTRQNWSAKGGYIAPSFIPATPNGELATMLSEIADEVRSNIPTPQQPQAVQIQTGWHAVRDVALEGAVYV